MNQVRQERLLKYISDNGALSVKEACALFPEVSTMTIHRDLEALSKKGLIIRTRGGAMIRRQLSQTESKLESRFLSQTQEKKEMAIKAVGLISAGSTIFLDAGTSCMALARELGDIELHVFTNAPNIALELCSLSSPAIHLCGGALNRNNLALSGVDTLEMLGKINIETAFLGVSGYTSECGFTCGKEDEMQVKRLIMKRAIRRVVLMDSSKCGKIFPYTFGSLSDATHIISDGKLPEDLMKLASAENVVIM